MNIVYIDDYKHDEEEILKSIGVKCIRIDSTLNLMPNNSILEVGATYEARGPRTDFTQYEKLFSSMSLSGLNFGTTPRSFKVGASFADQFPLLGDMSPKALVLGKDLPVDEILNKILENGLKFPVFVRSEIESAAKYVGVQGCTILNPSTEDLTSTIRNLIDHVDGFKTLIFKEMVTLAKEEKSGKIIEYRAIGIGGKLLDFDYDESRNDLPAPISLKLDYFANKAFDALSKGGANGGLFLDVAISSSGKPLVVECKNLFNGTIGAMEKFGHGLLTF